MTVTDLFDLAVDKGDSSAANVIDMIDAGEVDPKDAARIAELYEAGRA